MLYCGRSEAKISEATILRRHSHPPSISIDVTKEIHVHSTDGAQRILPFGEASGVLRYGDLLHGMGRHGDEGSRVIVGALRRVSVDCK